MDDNKLVVTIADKNGIRQFNVYKIVQKFALYFSVAILFVLLIGGLTIYFLNKNIDGLNRKIEIHRQSYEGLQLKNSNLLKDINDKKSLLQSKTKQLESVTDKLENIEELIGLSTPKYNDLNKRLDLAEISSLTISRIFNVIPNGYPLNNKGITSKFGYRIHPTLKRREFHRGIDLRAKMKTPVKATADGIVEFAGYHKKSGFGNLVIIDNSFGFKTSFAHLHSVKVKVGQFVKKGDIIALTGNSGLSSGPHLHYEIRFIQRPLDPIHFMNWSIGNYKQIFTNERRVSWDYLIEAINHQIQTTKQQ